jgi:DNA polymerase/3'-5' exonuclease PolX
MTYTGSAHHNRSLRLFAKLRGYALNNYGLYHRAEVMGDDATLQIGEKYLSSEQGLVDGARECEKEEDVYRLLKIAFVEPKDR